MINYMDEMYNLAHDNNILLSLMMELLTCCNEECVHCYIPEHNNMGLETDVVKRVISEFRELGGLNLSLTGGEIFLRSDIFKIIEYARSLNLRVFLLTNASLITEEIARKLRKLNIAELSVSIYSLDPEIHDRITKRQGALERTLRGLSYAKAQGIRIMVKTPLMECNKYSYKDLKKYCIDNGYKNMASAIIFSKSNGDDSVKDLSINTEEMSIIAKEVANLEPVGKRNYYEEACGSLKYMLAIDSMGDVFPCNSFLYNVGNIKNDSLSKIWGNKKLKKIQNIKKEDLKKCTNCELQGVCSRCPGLAWLEEGDYMGCSSTAMLNARMRL